MKRGPNTLTPAERAVLRAALARPGEPFHGYLMMRLLPDLLATPSALYKTLRRLEERGALASEWAEEEVPGRPRKRMYRITGEGQELYEAAEAAAAAKKTAAHWPRLVPRPAAGV